MKKKSLLLGFIFVILGLVSQGQIVETYRQGFEAAGENYGYNVVSGNVSTQSSLVKSGSRALQMSHSSTDAVIVLDTIDFTGNGSYQYFTFEFDHICTVDPTTCQSATVVAIIEAKRADQTTFTKLNGNTHYDKSGEYSAEFAGVDSHSKMSYGNWLSGSPDNTWWKHERFNLNTFFNGTAQASRKLIIRITLKQVYGNNSSNGSWWLDGLVCKASTQAMINPKIHMVNFPDLVDYPTSRNMRIEAKLTTSVAQGLNPDSTYMYYQLGTGAPILRQTMQVVSQRTNSTGAISEMKVRAYIPFIGYDTIVRYKIIAQDATNNRNQVSFPSEISNWETYKCVRGKTRSFQLANVLGVTPTTSTDFPFPNQASHRSQFIYDSALMAMAGYGPGAITGLDFTTNSSISSPNRRDTFEIRMCNVPAGYSIENSGNPYFFLNDMKTVYDSSITLNQNNTPYLHIDFCDTFFYAGKDILVQVISMARNNGTLIDPASVSFKTMPIATSKATVYQTAEAYLDLNPWTRVFFEKGNPSGKRPTISFDARENLPLVYDCGISGFYGPNDSTAADATSNNNVVLTLKNYGVATINAVTLYYQVDGGAIQSFNWSGSLAGGASTNVTVNTAQQFSVGYHEMLAWVDDSVTSNGVRYRDHEPLNDTCWTKMISCAGAMSGNVSIGGANADYATLDRFLYAVSQCGVNGPLHVKLAPGTYDPFVMPNVPGISSTNFVQFEPSNGSATSVQFAVGFGTAQTLVDLRGSHHVRFSKIKFVTTYANNTTYPVRLSINSTGCQFSECTFVEGASTNTSLATSTRAAALLYSGGADSLVVDRCSFSRGTVGLSMVGPAADNLAHGAVITRNYFENQGENSMIVRNHVASVVDSNTSMDVLTNRSYVMLFQDCHDNLQVTRNTVYVTKGASCLGVTDLYGTAAHQATIANNMLICNDDGTTNMLTTPMFIITADYTMVAHNSVKMTAPHRVGIAAATFGGGTLDHCYFYNNIVACMDTTNYAFSYIPNAGNVNYIGYNIYYSASYLLNQYDGIACNNMNAWRSHISDANSQNVNPAFLSSTITDLRSYSQNVKNHGTPIASVPNDIFGTARNATSPCVGAFEFSSIPYDFEIVGLVEPYDDYCNVPTSAPLRVMIKNNGVNTFVPGNGNNLTLTYSRTNHPGTMAPGNSGNISVLDTIPGGATIIYNANANLQFPTNGMEDTTYRFSFWLTSSLDPNPVNDTSVYSVTAHYHPAAPSPVNATGDYGNSVTVTVNNGVQNWYSNVYASGRVEKSAVYWYADTNSDSAPIFRGNTYTTDVLYHDTTFYVRQHRDLPLVKITEVQIKNNGLGVTNPQPLWMNSQTAFAVELTNVGDYPANLQGDTLMLCAVNSNNTNANTSLNNKMYIFPNVTIQPGRALVVQFKSGVAVTDSSRTLGAATVSPSYSANFAILYRDKKGVVDGVAFNNMPPADGTVWTNNNVPASVWSGSGIVLDNQTAGVMRKGWPTNPNAAPSNSASYWQVADSTHSMHIGTVEENLIRFTDNGCLGDASPVHIHLNNLPLIDLALDSISMPEGCGLGTENVEVTIHNYGAQQSGQFNVSYSINGTTICTDTINNLLASGVVNHTFSTPANMYASSAEVAFNFVVWVDHVNGDNTAINDTTSLSVISRYTPNTPIVYPYDTVQYATRAILTALGTITDSLAWYDRDMNPLDTVNVFISDYLYADDTFYVSAFGPKPNDIQVGELAMVNGATAYPSPYNPNKKYGREQYIIKAEEMRAAGHSAGPITALSFYLDTIRNTDGSMTMDHYIVTIGASDITAFSNANAAPVKWQDLDTVFSATNYTITNAQKGWIKHNFTQPFVWDGTSNIVVGISRSIDPAISAGAQTRYTVAYTNAVYYKDDASLVTIGDTPGNGTLSDKRPDMLFTFQDYGCESGTTPIYVTVEGTPDNDAALQWPEGFDTTSFSSCGAINFDVEVFNGGESTIPSATINYWVDSTQGTFVYNTPITSRNSAVLTIATPSLTPGRHFLKAVVLVVGDTILVNDTVSGMINVSFCAGHYTIGPSATADYPSFQVALDTLYGAGIAGAVVFDVETGTYNEQLDITEIRGSSSTNTITFCAASGDSSDVNLVFSPVAANNYVLHLNGSSNIIFDHMTIYANGPAASSNAVVLDNASNIHFQNAVVKVKGTTNNQNSSCFVVNPGVFDLYIDSSVVDSGYYSVKTNLTEQGSSARFYFTDNQFTNFWKEGINMKFANEIYIRHNTIRTGVNADNIQPSGIILENIEDGFDIERNNIVLFDSRKGGKRPIVVKNCVNTDMNRGKIYNNMCVAHGTATTGQVSQGITIEGSQYINVYYNSVRVYAGAAAATTRAFSVDNSSGIYVLNNIFANFSRGYSYWLSNQLCVTTSNYNVFFSDTSITTKKLAKIAAAELPTIDTLRVTTGRDGNSLFDMPYFHGPDDLHLEFGLYNEKAQYLPEVINDIDGLSRPPIPGPCIGAHEYDRLIHNVAIMQFMEPTLECPDPYTIEADTLRVVVKLFNDGTSTETNLWWRAQITGTTLTTPTRIVPELHAAEVLFDTSYIVLPMGLIDTQYIHAEFSTDMLNDAAIGNNYADTVFFIDMAYDLTVANINDLEITTDVGHGDGCRLFNAPVAITLTNNGRKPIPTQYPLTIGYEIKLPTNVNYTVAQIPIVHEEQVYLSAPLAVGAAIQIPFVQGANIYPTGNSRDISVRARGWVNYQFDQKPVGNGSKDTNATYNTVNSWKSVASKYLPTPPVGIDLHIPYATWDTIRASQAETLPGTSAGRPIRWYRDSTDAEPYHAPTNYARSCWWETPQYFFDSTYYLSCVSTTNCTSYYRPVNVFLNPRVAVDAAIQAIEEPYSKVYMNNDTVKVRIINYGNQPISNIPVTYQMRRVGNNMPVLQEVTEVCTATIQPDQTYLFTFDSLIYMDVENVDYSLRTWTNLPNEQVRLNDTLRAIHTFRPLPENTYKGTTLTNGTGLDITHVSFSSLNHDAPEVGRTYSDFASINNPEVTPLRLIKGTQDTMMIEVANSDRHSDFSTGGFLTVMIDYNRDGYFDNTDPEMAQYGDYTEVVFADTITSRHRKKFVYTIPSDICLGHMRMRLVLDQGGHGIFDYSAEGLVDIASGQVQDYLLYVEDQPEANDVAVSRLVAPTTPFIEQDSTVVTILLSNKGANPIQSADINYRIINANGMATENFAWTGNIEPGRSEAVALPARHLPEGTSTYIIWANVYGDTNTTNDTLKYQFHRFQTRTLVLEDKFDNDDIIWFAQSGFNNKYTENVWEKGTPHQRVLNTWISDSSVYATKLNEAVAPGQRGNLSYLYSPIIDISQIRPDTISFWLASNLGDSAVVYLEYFDWQSKWQRVGTANDSLWYTSGNGFAGNTDGNSYQYFRFSTSAISGEFQQRLQFRFVFHARPGATAGDGVTIDNFRIGRAQRAIDVGVIAITHPTRPKFGQTIRPKVVIKNFGYDTIYQVNLAYRPYGSNLARTATYHGAIAPDGTTLFEFPDPFIVMADFPDTFEICAYTTVNMDIYWENDSTCKNFALSPLDNDMGMVEFQYPLDRIVAGDSITVTTRMRNYGQAPVSSANVTYLFNDYEVTETVDFNAMLGHPLGSFEFFNYTFRHKCRASMGTMHLTAWVHTDDDDYIYNDTITKTLDGIAAITDLRAREIVVDTSDFHFALVQVTIDNIGARAANNFTVGFWYDNDTSTLVVRQVNRAEPLAALTSMYYTFDVQLPARNYPDGYRFVTAFVSCNGDNDRTNDTTSVIATQFCDFSANKVLVEENRNDQCHVRLQLENVGNVAYTRSSGFVVRAVINGQQVTQTSYQTIEPGRVYHIDFDGTIAKSENRTYVGTGKSLWNDVNDANNETSLVEILNYFDDIPLVSGANGMALEQNYPNPFDQNTRIDFSIPTSGTVRFFVMDVMGRLVYQSESEYSEGSHSINFSETLLSTGVYYYGIEMDDTRLMRKMVYKK